MRFLPACGFLAVVLLTIPGCGGSDLPPPANPEVTPAPVAKAATPVDTAPPATPPASAAPVASAAPAASTPPAEPAPAASAAPAAAPELEGTLKARKGKELTLHFDGADRPAVGAKASLAKFFSGKPGDKSPLGALGGLLGGSISGWMDIADVTVKSVTGGDVVVTIDAEKSSVVVNGKPVNQFTPGAKIKLSAP